MFDRILVICTGNICRSPYGEEKLKHLLPNKVVSSAGVATKKSGLERSPADPLAIEVARDLGYDLSAHRARQVTFDMIDDVDLILAMERNQIEVLCEKFPTARSKAFLFGHWIGLSTIDDPYRKGEASFRQAFSNIDKAADSWLRKLG
ncbi:low molecular weight protein-tyrosine-phosphatase [Vibrio sp. WJH972]